MRNYLLPLRMVTAVMWVIPVTYAKWDDYNPGAGGIKWLPNCDYPGFDIASQPITAEQCGRACIDTVGCNAFSWHDGWCFLKRKPVNVHRSPLLVGGRCGFLPWEFDETPIIQTNNFARSVVNTISQVNPQQTNYPLNSPINQQQFSPRKPQITPQRNVQPSPSGKINIPSILVGNLNSPNRNKINERYSDSYPDHSKNDDEDYGSHQEKDYHREDVIDEEGNQVDDINDDNDQPEDTETEDNQAEEIDEEVNNQPGDVNDGDNQPDDIDNEDNQLDNVTDDENNQPGDVEYDDQPGVGDYEDN